MKTVDGDERDSGLSRMVLRSKPGRGTPKQKEVENFLKSYPKGPGKVPMMAPGQKTTDIQDSYQLSVKGGGIIKLYHTGSMHVAGMEPGRSLALELVEPWTEIIPVPPRKSRKRT